LKTLSIVLTQQSKILTFLKTKHKEEIM